jgi:hypothetical protein
MKLKTYATGGEGLKLSELFKKLYELVSQDEYSEKKLDIAKAIADPFKAARARRHSRIKIKLKKEREMKIQP